MIYLTYRRLMVESESTVENGALEGRTSPRAVCQQLVADPDRYALWHVWHDSRMRSVADRRARDRQIIALRSVHIEQIHRAALVRYLRKNRVSHVDRDVTLQDFHGVVDPRRAAISEHRTYVISASSQICAYDLLKLVGDARGIELLQDYQGSYEQYFGMFCENGRAARRGQPYLLRGLIPEARAEADALRARILAGERLPAAPVAARPGTGRSGRWRAIA